MRVAAFNAIGQAVDHDAKALQWSVEGPATLDGTKLTAKSDAAHQAVYVTATYSGAGPGSATKSDPVTGTARIRVIPPATLEIHL